MTIAQHEIDTSFRRLAAVAARRPLADRYLIGTILTLLVAVLRWWLDPVLGNAAAFAAFYFAVIFTAWYCGFGPALFALALGWCLASYLFDDSRGNLAVYPFRRQVGCAVYIIVGIYLAYLIDWLTRNIARRQQAESDLRASQEQLQLHQTELAHMSRLNVMGEMAASLAHELNQPLHAARNYARGCIHRLAKTAQPDAELVHALEQIAGEADRAAEIIRRVRGFVQKSIPRESAVSLSEIVQEAVTFIKLELKQTPAQITCELAPGTPTVLADPIEIEQVVVNLGLNALESMHELPEKERVLRIGTRDCDEQTVEVFIRDQGKGISDEEMTRIFEPFFTTKAEGMGMGLAICRLIVQAHEGRLWVSRNQDRGCTFHFTLPRFRETVLNSALPRNLPACPDGLHTVSGAMNHE